MSWMPPFFGDNGLFEVPLAAVRIRFSGSKLELILLPLVVCETGQVRPIELALFSHRPTDRNIQYDRGVVTGSSPIGIAFIVQSVTRSGDG